MIKKYSRKIFSLFILRNDKNKLMKNSLKLGLILALIITLYSLLIKTLMPLDFLFSGKNILITYGLLVVLLVFGGRKILRSAADSLDYGEALKWLFFASFIAMTISTTIDTFLYRNNGEMKVAFDDFIVRTQDATMRTTLKMTGASEEQIELQLENLHESMENKELTKQDYPFSFGKLPLNIFSGAISALILSLISAIFVKSKQSDI